ncbi:c-type cytochrome [Pelagibius sp. CAU 1746]|uniref:c-type cytochrome n=1 Tax=Pelagibius sp. CAU 1746 TaxID=3140370 RepID=UPI00325B4B86
MQSAAAPRRASFVFATLLAVLAVTGAAPATAQDAAASGQRKLVLPLANAEEGLKLFVGKGCVVCHAVNGVGGKAAPALDADGDDPYFDVFDFVARMWRGAPTMILLQEMELGYQIDLSGEELAHLAAFASDPDVQNRFGESDIPEVIRDWMVDEVYEELDPDNMTR